MASLYDGLGGEEVATGSVAGLSTQNPYFTGSVTAEGNIKAGGKNLSPVGNGSPSTWGFNAQAGSSATGAGSNVWVSFGTAFSATPAAVVVSSAETQEDCFAPAGSWQAGSFYVETISASQDFSWIAVGAD